MLSAAPSPQTVAVAAAHQAIFGSRYPNLMLNSGMGVRVCFQNGEYRTSNPAEIEFLLRAVADEARGNRGVFVRHLPKPEAPERRPRKRPAKEMSHAL